MPEVSVIIPSSRGGTFLREAIASVQAQTLSDWEIVVVMDGCDDDISDLVSNDQRVRVVSQPRRGVAIARNVGIEMAQSDLIAFLDDDDRMMPSRLRAQVASMSDPMVGLCYSQFRFIDESGQTIGPGVSTAAQYRDFLRDDGDILLSSTMVRRELVRDVGGFNPLLPFCEDLDLLYRVARECQVSFLPETLTEYRRHGSNVSLPVAGGEERRLILLTQLFAAKAHGEVENVRAIRHGMSYVMTGRTATAIRYAHEARKRRNYVGMCAALGLALLLSPRVTLRVSLRQTKRDRLRRRSEASQSSDLPGQR